MSDKTSLGDRMKFNYEGAYDLRLPMRMPIIIRIDGKAFHKYTAPLDHPFDKNFQHVMNKCAANIMKEVSGSILAYVQSDEISILVHNYKRHETQAYCSNSLQKLVSISSSIASATMTYMSDFIFNEQREATFDARAFVLPEAEVNNYFIWRQQDCIRNSVQSWARYHFSHNECNNKNGTQLKEMLLSIGKDWENIPLEDQLGRILTKNQLILTKFSDDCSLIHNLLKVEEE